MVPAPNNDVLNSVESTGANDEGTPADDGEPTAFDGTAGEPGVSVDGPRGGRDPTQALAAALVVVALLGAAALVPAVSTPLDLGLSGAGGDDGGGDGDGGTGSIDAAPGALTPDSRTGVGGSLGDAVTNRSDAVHFTVEADRATYWRTAAYGRYTGQGWTRDRDLRAYDPPVVAAEGPRLRQTVTLNVSARAVPTAWRPARVGADDGVVRVTANGAVRLSGGVDPGTTVRAVSRLQDATPGELAATAGQSHPPGVRRYTRLPEATPARLGAFTDELTREADSPYETARVVELWLERNKTYALNASHDTSRPVASQFVFEMDRGYCEYFATAMVAMLRTQNVPARYVVGYAPGRSAGDGRYEVRSVDAHAWVEVYFPDHGWVRFDPTPAADRRAAERRVTGADRRPAVPGSPGDDRPDAGLDPDDVPPGAVAPERVPPPPYEVSLNATAVPGRPVTVSVTKRDRPVEGVVVTVDGERAGRTDRNGEVVVRVPYTDSVTVAARPPEGAETERADTRANVDPGPRAGTTGPAGLAAVGTAGGVTSRTRTPVAVGGASWGGPTTPGGAVPTRGTPASDGVAGGAVTRPQDNGTAPREFDVATDVEIAVAEGVFAPGREATLVATVDGVPLRGVDVQVADAAVGRTDDDGRVRVAVPSNLDGETTVRVSRDDLDESVALALADLEVSVRSSVVVLLPGVEATATVTVGDRPVEGVRVYRDGRPVGVTDRDGTVEFGVPVADATRLRATGPYLSTTTRIEGLFLRLAGVGGATLALVGVGAALARRRRGAGGTLRDALAALGCLPAAVGRLRGRSPTATLLEAGRSLALLAGGGLVGLLAWVAGLPRRGLRAVRSPLAAVSGVLAWLRGLFTGTGPAPTGTDDADDAPGPDAGTGEATTVRAAWRAFVGLLAVPWDRARRMTPGELARRGVERGLPRGPVEWLRDAYRDAEYGGHDPPARDRVTAVLERLRREAPDDATGDDGGPAPDTGSDGPDDGGASGDAGPDHPADGGADSDHPGDGPAEPPGGDGE